MSVNKMVGLLRRTLLVLTAVLLLVTTSSGTISALGTEYFDTQPGGDCDLWNGNFTNDLCGGNNDARLIAGEARSVVKTRTKVRAYFDGIPHTTVGGVEQVDRSNFPGNLEVTIYGANYCPTKTFNRWADSAKGDGHYSLDGAGSTVDVDKLRGENITHYIIGGVDRYGVEAPYGSAACNDTRTVGISAGMLQWAEGISGVFYVDITANHIDKFEPGKNCENTPSSCDGILNSFTFRETGGTSHDYKIAQVGAAASNGADAGFATTIRQIGTADHSTFVSRFGADCTVVRPNTRTSLKFFDLDFSRSDSSQGQIHLYLRRESDGKWWHGQGAAGSPDPSDWRSSKDRWDPGPNNGGTTTWDFTANPQDKFRLYIANVGSILVQQFTTPYDGIYYERSCETTIRPSQSISPNGSPQLQAGGNATINSKLRSIVDYAGSVNSAKIRAWYSNSQDYNNYNAAGNIPLANGGKWISSPTTVAGKQVLTHTDDITGLNPGSYKYLCSDLTTSTDDPLHTHIDPVHTGDCQLLQLSYQPYLTIYGGDAIAGAAPNETGVECTTNEHAGFLSWNNDASPWAGAGSQLAVQAMGDIESFASGLGTANAPYKLSFANDDANTTGDYGGNFKSTSGVNCDYTSGLGDPTPAHDFNNLNITDGGPTTEYLKGDVVIRGDHIKYSNSSWTSAADIPNFKLVVIGNIYIEPSVKQLDGTYVAIPDGDRDSDVDPTGLIETCAMNDTRLTIADKNLSGPNGYYSQCSRNQLTINGAFVAKQVRFDRTFGTLADAKVTDRYNNNQAAENFVYSPEIWIASTPGIPQGANAYTGLPPVL